MRIAWSCFWLLTWVAGVAVAAQTDPQLDKEQRRIMALENAWNRALQMNDAKAVEPLMDAELIYIDYDGSLMNKAQYLAGISRPGLAVEHIVSESMQVQLYGQSAVVIGICRDVGSERGKRYSRRLRFVDMWINRGGVWVCVSSQSTLIAH